MSFCCQGMFLILGDSIRSNFYYKLFFFPKSHFITWGKRYYAIFISYSASTISDSKTYVFPLVYNEVRHLKTTMQAIQK